MEYERAALLCFCFIRASEEVAQVVLTSGDDALSTRDDLLRSSKGSRAAASCAR